VTFGHLLTPGLPANTLLRVQCARTANVRGQPMCAAVRRFWRKEDRGQRGGQRGGQLVFEGSDMTIYLPTRTVSGVVLIYKDNSKESGVVLTYKDNSKDSGIVLEYKDISRLSVLPYCPCP
jgi:hypothetical protein